MAKPQSTGQAPHGPVAPAGPREFLIIPRHAMEYLQPRGYLSSYSPLKWAAEQTAAGGHWKCCSPTCPPLHTGAMGSHQAEHPTVQAPPMPKAERFHLLLLEIFVKVGHTVVKRWRDGGKGKKGKKKRREKEERGRKEEGKV